MKQIKVIFNGEVLSDEEALNWLEYYSPKPKSKPRGFWRTAWDFIVRGRVS